jgi:hypothetical protein
LILRAYTILAIRYKLAIKKADFATSSIEEINVGKVNMGNEKREEKLV